MIIISWVLWGLWSLTVMATPNTDQDKEALYARLPSSLTTKTFDSALSKGFHLVEFFSPYCHHCNALLPTWVDLYEKYQKEGDTRFQIHQVNCVTDSDLCDRETIRYYPVIRFYGSESKLLGSMTQHTRTISTLTDFIDEQLMNWSDDANFDAGINPIFQENHLLNSIEMTNVIAGRNLNKPMLVSFWPANDDQLNDSNFQLNHKENKFFKSYPICYIFKNLWNLTLKTLSDLIENQELDINYFNCKSNSEICDALGFKSLTKSGFQDSISPKVILFLPSSNGGNAIHYNLEDDLELGSFNNAVKQLTHWTRKTIVNGKFEAQQLSSIKDFLNGKQTLDSPDNISSFEDYSKVGFVLVNDPQSEVPEDDIVFKHILQEVSNLPNDVYLLKTHDIKEVESFLQFQEKSLTEGYINLIPKDGVPPSTYDEELFVSKTHTTYPMIVCIKSGSLISPIYRSFQSEDMRSSDKILKFIKQNSSPIIDRLSLSNLKYHFPIYDPLIHSKSQKVLITLTDFQPSSFFDAEFYMSWVYHTFQYFKQKAQFAKIMSEREKKSDKVLKLKEEKADTVDIIMEMKKAVPNAFDKVDDFINVVYVDIKEWPFIVSEMGWSHLQDGDYKSGDSIIVSKFQNKYWNQTPSNTQITQQMPYDTVELLKEISLGNLGGKSLKGTIWFITVMIYLGSALIIISGWRYWRKKGLAHKIKKDRLKPLGILGLDPEQASKSD